MDKSTFDFELFKKQAAEQLKAGDSFFGRDGVLTPLLKEFVEEALDGELDAHLELESEQSAQWTQDKECEHGLGQGTDRGTTRPRWHVPASDPTEA